MVSKEIIMVTGGAGFIGSHLASRLVGLDQKVIVVDNFSTGRRQNLEGVYNIEIIEQDISDYDGLMSCVKGQKISIIYHLAALPRIERSIDNPFETHRANVDGVLSILQLARQLNIPKVIYASSSSVYGFQDKLPLSEELIPNPQNPYAAQKLMGEQYCDIYSKVYGLQVIALRLFNVYGPRMRGEGAYQLVFTKWLDQIKTGRPLTIFGDGEQTRDFTYVSDVVVAFLRAKECKTANPFEVINIGYGRQVSVNYLASLFDAPTVKTEHRKFEERFKQADISKAKRVLKWWPEINIEEGVAKFLNET